MWPIKMIKKSSKINMDIFKKKKAFKRHINKGALNICAQKAIIDGKRFEVIQEDYEVVDLVRASGSDEDSAEGVAARKVGSDDPQESFMTPLVPRRMRSEQFVI